MGISRKAFGIATAVALVAGGGPAAYAVRKNIMEAQACETVRAQIADTGMIRSVTTGRRNLVILGDSYSVGAGLADRAAAWPSLAGEAEGWAVSVAGVGGTGFVNESPCGGMSFAQRLNVALAANPETLIIAGGINDTDASPDAVKAAADALLQDVADVPTVVVVGPANAPAKENVPAIDAALSEAAATNDREYVSATGWDIEFQTDGLHPTEAGHKTYAKNVAARIP